MTALPSWAAEQYACQAGPGGGWSCTTQTAAPAAPPRIQAATDVVTAPRALGAYGESNDDGAGDNGATSGSATPPSAALAQAPACPSCAKAPSGRLAQEYSRLDFVPRSQLTPEQLATVGPSCSGAYIEPPRPGMSDDMPRDESPTYVSARASRYDEKTKTATLAGDVVLRSGPLQAEADEVRVYQPESRGELDGNVKLRDRGMLIVGDAAKIQLDTGEAQVDDAQYVVHRGKIRGSANYIKRDKDGYIRLRNGTYTRCEPGNNSWALKGNRVVLDPARGFGTATNATLRVMDIPVFYTPYIRFPIDDRRQSGFLMPSFGFGSNTGGFVTTPYYFSLAPNYDATLYPTYMSSHGWLNEVQGRYLTESSEGNLGVAYLHDKDDSRRKQSLYSRDRWLLHWDDTTGLDSRLLGKLDYTKISDPYYFQDLDTNLGIDTPGWVNQQGNLTWRGDSYTARLNAQAFQMATIDDITPYNRLPQLTVNGEIPERPGGLVLSYDTEAVRFQRSLRKGDYTDKNGDKQRWYDADVFGLNRANGDRLGLSPKASLPMQASYGYLTPAVRYAYNRYRVSLDDQGHDQIATNKLYGYTHNPSRGVPLFSLDSGLYFDRHTDWFGANSLQTLEPRAKYLYVPWRTQKDIPVFDSAETPFSYSYLWQDNRFSGQDRVGDANQLSLGVDNRWLESDGFERQRFSLGQSLYFEDRHVQLPGIDYKKRGAATHGVSPFATEYMYQFNRDWRLTSAYNWDPDVHKPRTANMMFHFQPASDPRKILNFGYRYLNDQAVYNPSTGQWQYGGDYVYYKTNPANPNAPIRKVIKDYYKIEQHDASFAWPILQRWNLVGRWQYDYNRSRTLEAFGGFEYDSCCWKLRLLNRYWINYSQNSLNPRVTSNEKPKRGIFLQIEFKGLGEAGNNNVRSYLTQSIPGFKESDPKRD